MSYRFVKQPNGKLALFDEDVNNFSRFNLSESDALKYCIDLNLDPKSAADKVMEAIENRKLGVDRDINRWDNCCNIISIKYGQEELNKVLEKIHE